MSNLVDDLALVTACRDAPAKATPGAWMDTDYEPEGQWDRAVYAAHDVPVALVWGEADALPIAGAPTVYSAALSLIEDTLNRHRPYFKPSRGCSLCGATARFEATALGTLVLNESDHWPCESYNGALTALHTIATALGVEVEAADG